MYHGSLLLVGRALAAPNTRC